MSTLRLSATGQMTAYRCRHWASRDICFYLVSPLCGDDNVELVDAVIRRREAAGLLLESASNVCDDAVKHDVRVFSHWTKVLRQTHEERHLLGIVRRVTCKHRQSAVFKDIY